MNNSEEFEEPDEAATDDWDEFRDYEADPIRVEDLMVCFLLFFWRIVWLRKRSVIPQPDAGKKSPSSFFGCCGVKENRSAMANIVISHFKKSTNSSVHNGRRGPAQCSGFVFVVTDANSDGLGRSFADGMEEPVGRVGLKIDVRVKKRKNIRRRRFLPRKPSRYGSLAYFMKGGGFGNRKADGVKQQSI